MQKTSPIAAVSPLLLALALGCATTDDAPSNAARQQQHALVARPAARLLLTDGVVARLQQRAAQGDPSWTALQKVCDDYSGATIHAPNGTDYPGYPDIGEGYQGDEYLPAIRALGLCYRTVRGVNAALEARYAAAGSRLLEAMSTPVAEGGLPPSTNSGYAIRHYGVGMALGYDWLYPALSSALRARVITAVNGWIDWYDSSGFLRNDPVGNYFTGYLLAKTTAALATEGDNPKAVEYWRDVQDRLWADLVLPEFSRKLAGGGWPEGWGYGKKAVLSVAETMWAVKTAKNLDWWSQLPLLREQATYIGYFAWPSLQHMDDQGTIRSGTNLRASTELASGLATMLEAAGDGYAAVARGFANDVAATAGDDRAPWAKFFYGDPGAAVTSYVQQPLSYVAAGPGHVAMRSSWDKSAVWGGFTGGSYINAKDSGEQLYGAGSFAIVHGDDPIVLHATGWLPQHAGTQGENFVYADSYESRDRRLYNTFFVEDASSPYSPGQNNFGPDESRAAVDVYEDGGRFVHTRASHLEDQYGWRNGSKPVQAFTRELVYTRPGTFVIYDRTSVTDPAADQWMALHTKVSPTAVASTDASQRRFDVPGGSIRQLLPANATSSVVALPGGAARLEARPAARAAEQRWLTVVTTGESAPEQTRLTRADGNVSAGDLDGVHVHGAREQVVLFATGASAAEYRVTQLADADHVVTGLEVNAAGYAVTASRVGGQLVVRVAAGGALRSSAAGTLSFTVTADGVVTSAEPAGSTQAAPSSRSARLGGAGEQAGALASAHRAASAPQVIHEDGVMESFSFHPVAEK